MPTPYNFPLQHYSSQSATSCYMECARRYLFNYKLYGKGIVPMSASIPLSTGTVIHTGIQNLMEQYINNGSNLTTVDVDFAVNIAKNTYTDIVKKAQLSGTDEQEYTYLEQCALTEALIRLWAKKEMPKIHQFYDVFAIEQEIAIDLMPFTSGIRYQSKPDLLLLDKKNGDLINYSLKSVKRFDERTEKSYKTQLQAVTEPYCTNEWIKQLKTKAREGINGLSELPIDPKKKAAMANLYNNVLNKLPDKSTATRFCYLIKGEWKKESEDKEEKIYRQDSPLIYGWRNFGPKDIRYAWSWFVPKAENKSGWGTLGKGWEKFSVWDDTEIGGVKGWLELIEDGEKIQGDLGNGHIFDKYIVSMPEVYVNGQLMDRRIKQIQTIEENIATDCYSLLQAELSKNYPMEGLERLVDEKFPMNTGSCYFPTPCSYLKICPNGNEEYKEHIANNPLSGEYGPLYQIRESHHKPEAEYLRNRDTLHE